IDVTLPVGQANETVEVTSETPLLQSETSSLGQVVEQRKANELPLNGRNIYTLAAIAPSVIPQGNTTGSPVGKNPFDFANYQIGGTIGGQVIKDKTFAFFSYEGYRLRTGTPFLTTVPTALERTGDFSDLCPTGFTAGLCNDGIHQIYDPLTTPRQPFLNNCISISCGNSTDLINPTAAFLLSNYIPNATGSGTVNNFFKASSTGGNVD